MPSISIYPVVGSTAVYCTSTYSHVKAAATAAAAAAAGTGNTWRQRTRTRRQSRGGNIGWRQPTELILLKKYFKLAPSKHRHRPSVLCVKK